MKTRAIFQKFLESGAYCSPPGRAACALQNTKTLQAFRQAESDGRVRIRYEGEQESYFDVYGEPDTEKERKAILAELERHGCWFVVTEFLAPYGEWEHADSIGMCVYSNPTDPFENCYVPDLMSSALEKLENAWEEAAAAV